MEKCQFHDKDTKSFNNFSLNDLYNVLKAHETEVNEIAEESKISLGGPLYLVSKVVGRDLEKETVEKEISKDEGLIVNSDDEAIAFYSNNRVKKFFKKPFNVKSRASDTKGSFVGKSVSEEKKVKKNEVKSEETNLEKKLKGDSIFDFNYCNGANHMETISCCERGMKRITGSKMKLTMWKY